MTRLIINISLDNAAFEDPSELARILRSLAEEAEVTGNIDRAKVRDSNGNVVGSANIYDETLDTN